LLRTLGTLTLAFQSQGLAGDVAGDGSSTTDIISLLKDATPLSWAVLVILLLFSAASWGIIVHKRMQFAKAQKQTATFLDIFRKSSRFSEVHTVCGNLSASPLVGLFQAGYAELNTQLRAAGEAKPGAPAPRPTLRSLDSLDRALLRATTVELTRLESRVGFLATTASITPYIGLFGTVVGIMASFQGIGSTGSTSLAVVAPGIAEALVATAAGLFAAIPAVYFYNDLTGQVKGFAGAMDDFSMEFLNIAERNFS
jgi:biopolymer transport protein TolQ